MQENIIAILTSVPNAYFRLSVIASDVDIDKE